MVTKMQLSKNFFIVSCNFMRKSVSGICSSSTLGSDNERNEKKNVDVDFDIAPKVLTSFASEKNLILGWHKFQPFLQTKYKLKLWNEKTTREAELLVQSFIKERHEILGCDLATAHFVVHRGGKVKFLGSDEWFKLKPGEKQCTKLPNNYVKNLFLEAVDVSGTSLRYEGLLNCVKLTKLKWLSFNGCSHIDDWCIDKISGEYYNSLEYLDIGNCSNISERAFSCLYRFKNLKVLKVTNVLNSKIFELSCLLLEESFPNLSVEGVQYFSLHKDVN